MIQVKRMKEIVDFLQTLNAEELEVLYKLELREENVSKRRKYKDYSSEDWLTAKNLLKQGNTVAAVSRATGINYSTLKNYIKRGL